MAGGGMGAEGAPQTSADNGQGTYAPPTTSQDNSSYYNSLVRPGTAGETVSSLYQSVLGRAPEAGAQDWWANQAKTQNWTARDLAQNFKGGAAAEILNSPQGQAAYLAARPDVAQNWRGTPLEHYMQYGINEPHATGTALDRLNPQAYSNSQTYTRPSAYNTNPVGVDYANIFNPAARSITQNQPVMTPQQQANYLDEWAQDYSRTNRAATQAANLERKNTANAQWEKYLTEKAKAEAAAPDVINKAVEEKLAGMGYGQNSSWGGSSNEGWYTGKAGGSVPSGLRSLKGLTKP